MGKGTWTPCMSGYLIVKMHQVWAEDKTGFKEDQFSVPVALDSCEGFKPATNAAQPLCLVLKSAFRPNSYYYSITLRDILKRNCSRFGLQLTFSKGHEGDRQTDGHSDWAGRILEDADGCGGGCQEIGEVLKEIPSLETLYQTDEGKSECFWAFKATKELCGGSN